MDDGKHPAIGTKKLTKTGTSDIKTNKTCSANIIDITRRTDNPHHFILIRRTFMQGTKFTDEELNILKEKIEEELDYKAEAKIQHISKSGNNYAGIIIMGENMDIGPVIPLDMYHEDYEKAVGNGIDKTSALHALAHYIADEYSNFYCERIQKMQDVKNSLKDILADKDKILDQVIMRVVGKTKAKEYLKDKPYTAMGDICAMYGIEIDAGHDNCFTAITTKNMKNTGISTKELHEAAVKNTMNKYPLNIETMPAIFAQMGMKVPENDAPLTVVSNTITCHGAAVLFYPDFKDRIAKVIPDGCAIIPSSRHELLITPCDNNEDLAYLEHITTDINKNMVDAADLLSDKPFIFDGKDILPKFGERPMKMTFRDETKREKTI